MRNQTELEREIRAMRPRIDGEFASKLDEWAAAGFPAEGEAPAPARARRTLRLRPVLPKLAFAASMVVIAGTISIGVLSQETGSDDSGGDPGLSIEESPQTGAAGDDSARGGAEAAIQDSGADIGPAPTTVSPVPPRQEQLRPGEDREVARDATMKLSTEPGEVAEVADGVVEVTERYDGIVLSSEVDTNAERGRATFDLRIPAQNLQAALADLSDLASVSERNEGSIDVTAPFVTAQERFDDAKAEVDALVGQLGEAASAGEIAEIRERLQPARAELAAARAELAGLKQRTDFSALAVTVVGDGDADGWSLGDAADDAVSVLEDLGGATLVALAVIVPLGLLGAAAWFGYAAIRRRSRERALDE